uniref:Uncharacterized protein n=1 Tax=Acrobeloides nanus TaxID=290746 RepID=A0A914CDM9_9BILA
MFRINFRKALIFLGNRKISQIAASEPICPSIQTSIPGPISIRMKNEMEIVHTAAVSRPSQGLWPRSDFIELIRNSIMAVAPKGMTGVQIMQCGSTSNENALKCAFIRYQALKRNGKPPTSEDLESCMDQKIPGTPNLCVLSFRGGLHGRTLGMLSITRSKAIHKLDFPAFNWPVANFPRYRYPLEENMAYNKDQDEKCLYEVTF